MTSCSTIRSETTSSEFCSGLLGAGGVSQGVSCVLVLTCSGPEQSGCLSVRAVLFFVFIPMLFSVRSGLAGLRRFRKQRSYHSSLGGFASDAFVALSSGYTCHSGAAGIYCRSRNTGIAGFGAVSYSRSLRPDGGDKGRAAGLRLVGRPVSESHRPKISPSQWAIAVRGE